MGTLASGSIDLKSLKVAGEGATSYITAIDNNGIKVHAANNIDLNYTQITSDGMEIFKTNGAESNPSAISIAKFGEITRIGKEDESHLEMDYHSLKMIDKEGNIYLNISDLRDANGTATVTKKTIRNLTETTLLEGQFISLDFRARNINDIIVQANDFEFTADSWYFYPQYSRAGLTVTSIDVILSKIPPSGTEIIIGYDIDTTSETIETTEIFTSDGTTATFTLSRAGRYPILYVKLNNSEIPGFKFSTAGVTIFGTFINTDEQIIIEYVTDNSRAKAFTLGSRSVDSIVGAMSFAIGNNVEATEAYSFATGDGTKATGNASFAEGYHTTAIGVASHAEGFSTLAKLGHAEGSFTEARGIDAHAEGYGTIAKAEFTHAQNKGTIASKSAQTAIGQYNIEDIETNHAFIIGNGRTDSERSNALTVDWQGRIECGDYSGVFKSIFNILYPVGSYYETSLPTTPTSGHSFDDDNLTDAEIADCGISWFDPRVMWGGTWGLELPGQVHVSGTSTGNYPVLSTYTDTSNSDGTIGTNQDGSKDAIIPKHTHTINRGNDVKISVSGSVSTQPAFKIKTASPNNTGDYSTNQVVFGKPTGTTHTNSNPLTRSTNAAISVSGSVTQQPTFTSSEPTNSESVTNKNMQPYINVYRWHRIA